MDFNNPDFKKLFDAFNKFSAAHNGEDLAARVIRAVSAGGKTTLDKTLEEFPKTFISKTVKDFYALATSQEVADSIGSTVNSFDEEKIVDAVDKLALRLKDRDTALQVAKTLKEVLSKTSTDDVEAILDQALSALPKTDSTETARMMFPIIFSGQIKPLINEMRTASEEEIAEIVVQLADNIPSELIAAQLGGLTREITPERISQHTQDVIGKLPSAGAIADIIHGAGTAASEQLDGVAKNTIPADPAAIVKQLASDITAVVTDTIAKDNIAKKTPKKRGTKKGGDFNFKD